MTVLPAPAPAQSSCRKSDLSNRQRSNGPAIWFCDPSLNTVIASRCSFSKSVRRCGGRRLSPSFNSPRIPSTASAARSMAVVSKCPRDSSSHSSSVMLVALTAARVRGHHGGRPYKMTASKLRLAQAAMGKPQTQVSALCVATANWAARPSIASISWKKRMQLQILRQPRAKIQYLCRRVFPFLFKGVS